MSDPAGLDERDPFESIFTSDHLEAQVVEPGDSPRIHGYEVEADLARNYSFAEVALLALTGAIPGRAAGQAFEKSLVFLAPASVAEAPVHTAVLSHLCGAPTSGALSAGTIALTEQAHHVVGAAAPLLEWLDTPGAAFPTAFVAQSAADRESVFRLREALRPTGLAVRGLDLDPSRLAALLCVFHACGLRTAAQIEATWTLARLPVLAAEALAADPKRLREYPLNLPPFEYVEGPR